MELATAYGDTRARDIEASLAPFRARVPAPLASLKDSEAKWDTSGKDALLVVKMPGAIPKDFFSDLRKAQIIPNSNSNGRGIISFSLVQPS